LIRTITYSSKCTASRSCRRCICPFSIIIQQNHAHLKVLRILIISSKFEGRLIFAAPPWASLIIFFKDDVGAVDTFETFFLASKFSSIVAVGCLLSLSGSNLKVSFLPTFLTTLSVNGTTEGPTFYERCLFSFCDKIWFSFSNYSKVIALSRSRNWRVLKTFEIIYRTIMEI